MTEERIYMNNGWLFTEEFTPSLSETDYDTSSLKEVRIPHTVKETPFHYFDESIYQMESGYRRVLFAPKEWEDKRVLLTFDGVAHSAYVYLNGELIGEHHNGYTAFTVELTPLLKYGEDNTLVVCVDSRESQNIPPFGYVIDYMTYGGIYRDVYLEVKESVYLSDVCVRPSIAPENILPGATNDGRRMAEKLKEMRFDGTVDFELSLDSLQEITATHATIELTEFGTSRAVSACLNIASEDDTAEQKENLSASAKSNESVNPEANTAASVNPTASESSVVLAESATTSAAYNIGTETQTDSASAGTENTSDSASSPSASELDQDAAIDALLSSLPPLMSTDPIRVDLKANADGTISDLQTCSIDVTDVKLWDVVAPNLYEVKITLYNNDTIVDVRTVRFGFRVSDFRADGYFLNGRRIKLRGLNRHQSYPYVGYAMPASQQRADADILRFELGVNAVRTSHYPQSQYFIDRCDEIGLLVFTEIPGWQHIGNEEWKDQAVENVAEMVLQYRNHPSIILWGVRINESLDDDEFYTRTNEVAHTLDITRPTGGVRYLKKSHLLEDVYTYNDFLHDGKTAGCDKKSKVTSDMSKPYLISEFNGHMYPTKTFDDEPHRLEHALRHANVLDAVSGERDILGCFGWCMFDYNTHKDFGSGDRICYHGVMDMFRNPKLAAAVYTSQQNITPFLKISSSMEIGEHPAGNRGAVYIFTNAEKVRMYKNGRFISEFTHANSPYKNMKNAPILIDDFIGNLLVEDEGFTERQSKIVKEALNYISLYGMNRLPLAIQAKMGEAMAVYHMKFEDAYALYGKYVGNWGQTSTVFRFDALNGDEIVKSITKSSMTKLHMEVRVDHDTLKEENSYDVVSLRIRMCDENKNIVEAFNESLPLDIEGPAEIIGPHHAYMTGGMGGTYIKSIGTTGEIRVTINPPESYKELMKPVVVTLTAK